MERTPSGYRLRNTDPDGFIYVAVKSANGNSSLALYADQGQTRQVAIGALYAGAFLIVPSNNSGLSGNMTTGATTNQFVLSVVPRLLSWQRQHLRGVWQQEDFQFTQGAITGDVQSQIISCTLTGVQPGKNTDANGNLYISLQEVAGPEYQVTLYSDAARTKSVASGASSTASGQVVLTAANTSGLSGTVTINYKADSTQISLPMVFTSTPLIDPDVLVPGDFKYPIANDPAYSLYTARQTTVQGWISQLQTQAGGTLVGLNIILQSVLKDPEYYPNGMQVSDIIALGAQLQQGNDISAQLAALQLPLDAFTYLLQLCPLVQNGLPLLASEWSDIYSILAQVQKVRAYTAWCIAELNGQMTLGPDYFNYPPSPPALANTGVDTSGRPLFNGSTDPRWTIISAPSSSTPAAAYVTDNLYPIGAAWLTNDANSQWISPQTDESVGDAAGLYTYRTTLDLTGYDPTSVTLTLQVAVADELSAVRLNGVGLGLSASGSSGFTTLSIGGPFQAGVNTLDFVVNNAGTTPNPSGLRVAFSFAGPPSLVDLPAWRATAQQRQAWEGSLEARINEDNSLVAGLQAVVDRTEQQTLTELRDALVEAASCEAAIPSLYSTGTAFRGAPDGEVFVDLEWTITSLPSGTSSVAYVSSPPNAAWMSSGSASRWVSPSADESNGKDATGNYTYQTTFDLSLFGPSTVQIQMNVWLITRLQM